MTTMWISDSWAESRKVERIRHFRYWTSVLGLALADIVSFVFAHLLFRATAIVPAIVLFVGRQGSPSRPIDLFLILAAFFVAIRYVSGDYGRRQLFWDGTKVTTIALLVASLPDFLVLILASGLHYSATRMLLSWIFLLVSVPLLRQLARIVMAQAGIWHIPTAMIGVGQRAGEVYKALTGSLSLGFDVRWLVVEEGDKAVPAAISALPQIHSSKPERIALAMYQSGCKEAIIAAEDMQSEHFAELAQRLLEVNIPVAVIPTFTRLPFAGVTTNYFFGHDILLLQMRSNVQRLPWRFAKRSFDIIFSIIFLTVFLPLFLIVAIAIKRAGPGNVTYAQTRIGRGGQPFSCYKFRTMVHDADACLLRWQVENPDLYEEYLKTYKLRDDPRITSVGKWLRRTSLDELPQLWNVLRGDMSLVGPRPVVAQELTEYYGPAARLYVQARPGITGLWQVSGRSDTTYERRVILDEWYILNWSFWYDIIILFQTAWIVVSGKGAF